VSSNIAEIAVEATLTLNPLISSQTIYHSMCLVGSLSKAWAAVINHLPTKIK
jgi:hypothetical protein